MSKKRKPLLPQRSREELPAASATPNSPEVASPTGRPPGLNPEQLNKMLDALRWGNYRDDAAEYAGIAVRTMRRWCALGKRGEAAYVGFWHSVLEAEQHAKVEAVRSVYQAGAADPKHRQWWLERKFPDQFASNNREIAELKRRLDELEKESSRGSFSSHLSGDGRANHNGTAAPPRGPSGESAEGHKPAPH